MERGSEHRYYLFLLGTAVGAALGLALASIAASTRGRYALVGLKSLFARLLGREEGVHFEVLLQ